MEPITLAQKSVLLTFLAGYHDFEAVQEKIRALDKDTARHLIADIDKGCSRIAYGTKTPFPDRNERIANTGKKVLERLGVIEARCSVCKGFTTSGQPLCHC